MRGHCLHSQTDVMHESEREIECDFVATASWQSIRTQFGAYVLVSLYISLIVILFGVCGHPWFFILFGVFQDIPCLVSFQFSLNFFLCSLFRICRGCVH